MPSCPTTLNRYQNLTNASFSLRPSLVSSTFSSINLILLAVAATSSYMSNCDASRFPGTLRPWAQREGARMTKARCQRKSESTQLHSEFSILGAKCPAPARVGPTTPSEEGPSHQLPGHPWDAMHHMLSDCVVSVRSCISPIDTATCDAPVQSRTVCPGFRPRPRQSPGAYTDTAVHVGCVTKRSPMSDLPHVGTT
jgi:hypothetical protein